MSKLMAVNVISLDGSPSGYDVASGWGTIDATVFVRQLRNYS